MLLDALLVQAWQAVALTSETMTLVTAGEDFGAAFLHHSYAFLLSAHISECWFVAERWLCKRLPTETTFKGRFSVLGLFTAHAGMVRLHVAVCAEILGTASASYTVSSLMLSCLT